MNRQGLRSRKMLQDSLLALLERKVFQKITITELCEEANLSRRTYYDHFETKEELLASVIEDQLVQHFDEAVEKFSVSVLSSENKTVEEFFKYWKSNRKILHLLRQAECDSLLLNGIHKSFIKLHREVTYDESDNPVMTEYTLRIISAGYFAALMYWDDRGMKEPPELLEQYLYALINPKTFLEIRDDFSQRFDQYS